MSRPLSLADKGGEEDAFGVKIGLIGLPAAGKSTLLRLLTKGEAGGTGKSQVGVAPVPDPRVDALVKIYNPQRTVYAQLECVELPSLQLQQGAGAGAAGVTAQQLAEALRHVDAIVQVVRAFSAPHVPHVLGEVNAFRDAQTVYEELLLMDWSLVETRLTRLKEAKKKGLRHDDEIALFERLQPELEAGRPLRAIEVTNEEGALLRAYSFLTTKPLVLAVNVDEDQLGGAFDGAAELTAWTKDRGVPVVEVAALIEAEIEELPAEEQAAFLEDLGLEQSGVARLARSAYEALDLISFFTAATREVHAWTVPSGTGARQAARVIHSDIERGFIRAEVVHYDDLVREGGMAAVKEKGLLRLEGKDYVVQDGDIIHFRFNV